MKTYITVDQAISVLPDGDFVHTFYNTGFSLVGADWSREDIIEKILNSDIIELTGRMARGMGHSMCVYNNDTKCHDEILFIETDETRLAALEQELEALKDES